MADDTILKFDVREIRKFLPHRYPFLLVDRVTECVAGKYCKGYKNLTINEEFFQGHFPNYPVMPGVLQIEALAQLTGCIIMTQDQFKGKFAFFAGIDKARFKTQVVPGDKFEMESEIIKIKYPLVKAHARGFVDGKLAVDAELLISIADGIEA